MQCQKLWIFASLEWAATIIWWDFPQVACFPTLGRLVGVIRQIGLLPPTLPTQEKRRYTGSTIWQRLYHDGDTNQSILYMIFSTTHLTAVYISISLCSPSFYSLFQQKAEKIKLQEFSIPVTPSGVGRDQEEKFVKCL